ncbi:MULTISPECIES: RecQ family ATP-dependent DNA helicase [unclassified Pseudoalteromonas]|uniref:RecQ family ATP-dependent DNA helicase n=1 Tax=unclassified Pseudoalteromonas TaxID=194690 RepID=UPI003014E1C8
MNHTQAIEHTLKRVFGHSSLRQGQQEVVESVLNRQSAIAIFATGAGKSLCYQLPAVILPGTCVVVSPLLALMHEQCDYLTNLGISAACLDSSQTKSQLQATEAALLNEQLKVLFISVERLNNPRTRQLLQRSAVSMLVVDEAHCISEWGHNFRPDYLKIATYRQQLGIEQVLLLTATATHKVANDMADKFAISHENIVRTGFYRENLHLTALAISEAEKLNYTIRFLTKASGCGIIYVTQQKQAEELAQVIAASGFKANAFHAGLNSDTKAQLQAEFLAASDMVIVATIAFGMGVDKPDVRWILHYDMAKSIEGYSQEIGRAGRDGETAHCVILLNNEKTAMLENYIHSNKVEHYAIKKLFAAIFASDDDCHINEYDYARTCNLNQLVLKTLLVQLELEGLIEISYSYFKDISIAFTSSKEKLLAQFDPNRQAYLNQVFSCFDFKKKWGALNHAQLSQQQIPEQKLQQTLDYLSEHGLIEIKLGKFTTVYRKPTPAINIDALVEQYLATTQIKEQGELQRLRSLMQFFQSNSCYHYSLAHYFKDDNAPEQCGHCSVCKGKVVTVPVIAEPDLSIEQIRPTLQHLQNYAQQCGVPLTRHLATLFLLGLHCPYFSRYKFRQLDNFAMLEGIKYNHVFDLVAMELPV